MKCERNPVEPSRTPARSKTGEVAAERGGRRRSAASRPPSAACEGESASN